MIVLAESRFGKPFVAK